jgi:two-component system, cell cycle response regulator
MQAEAARKRVLVVDDSKFVRTTFRSILSSSFTVLEEADGEAAWDVVSRDPGVVMVFTDLDMPRLDGFGLLGRIRGSSDARVRAMPVAIITGDEQAATKKRAREAGANSFISKSADAREVMTRIDRLLKMVHPSPAAAKPPSRALAAAPAPAPAPRAAFTGVLDAKGLLAEGRRHYASARRFASELSVMAMRIDSYADFSREAGADMAEHLLGQIAKVALAALRSGDALGRIGPDTFVLLAPGAAAAHIGAVARRLREQLENAQVGYRGRALRIACSFGLASAANDGGAASIEDLLGLAVQRLAPAARPRAQPQLGEEVERALRVLERAGRSEELLRRVLAIAKSLKGGQQ